MLTQSEQDELDRSERAMQQFDEIDPDEVDLYEYQALLSRIVELRKKRDTLTAADLKRLGSTPEAKSSIRTKRERFG